MFWIIMALGCVVDENPKKEFTTSTDTLTDTGNNEPGNETGDTSDTGENHPDNVVNFITDNVSCEKLEFHTLTLTRMMPGELVLEQNETENSSMNDDLEAIFYEEKGRLSLGDTSLTDVWAEGQSPSETAAHCRFSVTLSEPDETEMVVMGGDEENSTLKWTFYYPALFVGERVICDSETYSCENNETFGLSGTPEETEYDPELADGDHYNWASDVYFVYITGDLTASFVDMGFKRGWNLAQFDGDEITNVQPVSDGEEGDLMPISVETETLSSRYSISLTGTKLGIDTSLVDGSFTMGARPLGWLSGVHSTGENPSASPIDFNFRITTPSVNADSTFEIYFWGLPSNDHFFPVIYDTSNDMYQQWAEYINVAPEIPVIFEGVSSYVDGDSWVLGQEITYQDTPIGGLCSDSDRVAFVYYDTPNQPSETLWYRLTKKEIGDDFRPGWHALTGTQGDASTWRFIVENSNAGTHDYTNLSIASTCTAFDDWGN
jgi:hypothetical protein